MAANDEYLSSQGLNVKRNHNDFKEKKGIGVSTGSSKRKELDNPSGNHTKERMHDLEQVSSKSNQNEYALLDSVAEVMKGSQDKIEKKYRSGMSNNGTIEMRTKLEILQDDHSIDSDEENDPIMRMIGGKQRQISHLERKRDFIDVQAQSMQDDLPVDQISVPLRKDPNRFMSDLDERVSKSNDFNGCKGIAAPIDIELSATKPNRFDAIDMFGKTSNRIQWLREVTGFTVKNTHDLIPTAEYETNEDLDEEAQNLQVQSSALLGNDENANAELQRISKRMNTTAVTYLLGELDRNRQYFGIFVTFCLTSIYFFKLM